MGNNREQSSPVRTDDHVRGNALPAVGSWLPPGPRCDAVSQACSSQDPERVPGLPRVSGPLGHGGGPLGPGHAVCRCGEAGRLSQGPHTPGASRPGRASCITSSSKAVGGNRMDKPGLAWGCDDITAAPAAWVPWSQRVPEAPGETGTQDQGTDGARRPRAAGWGVSPQHYLPDKTSVCR